MQAERAINDSQSFGADDDVLGPGFDFRVAGAMQQDAEAAAVTLRGRAGPQRAVVADDKVACTCDIDIQTHVFSIFNADSARSQAGPHGHGHNRAPSIEALVELPAA